MSQQRSISELVQAVNEWCEEHGVSPVSGQAAERITERNVRFYRTVGLLDAPDSGGARGYGEKHRLQLVSVRLLQARGVPLRQIRELLHGRSLEELRRVESQGLRELKQIVAKSPVLPPALPIAGETWSVAPLDEHLLLLSRSGRLIPPSLREHLAAALRSWYQQNDSPRRT